MESEELKATVDKVEKESTEFLQSANIEELIKSNQIEFEVLGTKYRVTRPTFAQRQQAVQERTKKFVDLLKDPNNLLEKDLVALYESRGISIKELDTKYDNLQNQRNDYQLKLGKALEEKKPESECEIFKVELYKIIAEQNKLMMQKSVLLDSTIESQINLFIFTYLASILTERLVVNETKDAVWTRAWDNYASFVNETEEVVNPVVWHTSLVSKNEIPQM